MRVLRPLLCFSRFKFLLSVLFLFRCYICFAFYFLRSLVFIVSPYVYYCYLTFVYNVRTTAAGWEPSCGK